jgi:starch-binding outer membrane protein, SusD/RagB family
LSVVYHNPVKLNGRREDAVRPLSESKNATGGDQPIWAMAEAFPMKDGKTPGDPASAYTYNVQTFWKDRDPRFEATMVWNGAIYEISGIKGRRQYTMAGIAKSMDAWGYIIQGEAHYRTGLYTRKGIMEELPSVQVDLNDVDWPEIRYAEVLFNYAEAANETNRPNEALDVLKAIRHRAGIIPGANGLYGLKENMTRTEMREAILHEKYVEMMFEGHRFWDLRRHRMLNRLDGMRKYGIMAMKVDGRTVEQLTQADVTKGNNFQWLPEDFEYEVVELITAGQKTMSMPAKYYFFPIQLSHIDQNSNLKQNKDWGGDFNPEL